MPDGILFADYDAKGRAIAYSDEWRRYQFGSAIIESKRWNRPLDRRSNQRDEVTAPSTQMLRYLRRVDDLTNGALRWGILTNGTHFAVLFSISPEKNCCEFVSVAMPEGTRRPTIPSGLQSRLARSMKSEFIAVSPPDSRG